MNETVLLLAVVIFGLLLAVAMVILVMQLRHRFELEEKKPAAKPQPKQPLKSDLKRAVIIVNGEEFEIFYKPSDEKEVIRLTELIKHSLSLLKETKYKDIIASRSKECETLIKQLPKVTTLKQSELNRILEQLREFVNSL